MPGNRQAKTWQGANSCKVIPCEDERTDKDCYANLSVLKQRGFFIGGKTT